MTRPVPALALSALALLATACASTPDRPVPTTDDPHLATAYRVLATTPLIDGHNDLPWAIRTNDAAPMDLDAYDLREPTPGHTDIARLREGMVGGQFWSVYVPASAVEEGAARVQLEQIDLALRMIERYPDVFELATTPAELVRIFEDGKIASMLGMEGGHAIENSLGALRAFHELGARYMTLTHSANIDWADSCCEAPELDGLSAFGEEVVREMNRLGMLVDLSHVSPATMHDVLDVTAAPVLFSHSSAFSVTEHPRNVPDDVLRRVRENNGVVMVTYVTVFVNQDLLEWYEQPAEERTGPAPESTIDDVIAHLEHVRDVAGIDHVGLGSDYDGATMPTGVEDVSTFPFLLAELSRRGWSESDLRKLAGENVLRVWRDAEAVAARLRTERPPSVATIAGLDGLIGSGQGAFVTRLGDDTLAVERFRYTPSTLDVLAAVRAPTTQLMHYRGDFDLAGNLRSLQVTEYDPASPPSTGGQPIGGARFTFGEGSVEIEGRNERGEYQFVVEAGSDALPFIEMIHWPFEIALIRRAAGSGEEVEMLAGRRALPFRLLPLEGGHMEIQHPFRGTMDVVVDGSGRIVTLDAANTTRKLTVERVTDLDIAALARDFARRDAEGAAIGALSGRGEAVGTIGGATVVVDYGVPKKRGREVFGALVPFDEVWRTGANRATHLTTDRDLVIGGTAVPAGSYTLFTIPGPDEWTLIINSATDITGTAHDPATDFARVPMRVRAVDTTVEDFTIEVDETGFLRMRWDRTEAYVPVRAR